jgi:periplasmic protein TonB
MASLSLADQLQDAIEMMIAEPDSAPPKVDLNIGELLAIAAELRLFPDPEFRAALGAALLTANRPEMSTPAAIPAPARNNGGGHADQRAEEILPTLFGAGYGAYPVHRRNFAVSAAAHVALIAVVASVGVLANRKALAPRATSVVVTDISPYMLPASSEVSGGGGGGGDRDKAAESKGSLPRFSREQIAPPAIVVRNEEPKLPEEPTVVGPPQLTMPATSQLGNPLAAALEPPSNGTGSGSGLGSGAGGGIGSGTGPGVGPGQGGGIGGGVLRVGGGVSAPRAIYAPDPQYSDEARRAKYQGTVVLWVVIGPDGRPRDLHVVRTLGMGLDEKALEAVRQWKFEPAMKDGHPVAVQVNIEVSFRLY